jgi:protein-disulfide isomerase
MSRKSERNRPAAPAEGTPAGAAKPAGARGTRMFVALALAVLLAFVAAIVLFTQRGGGGGPAAVAGDAAAPDPARAAALASTHSPLLGNPAAKVHVVEFLDPACETCAAFFPIVKDLMAQNPDRIRLSVRHVAFHEGAEYAVRVLEASRAQDRYWQTLEALLGSQQLWAPNHTVRPELVDTAIASVGLDMQRLAADVNSPEVTERIQRDLQDAKTLRVTATPEYFVDGRPMPSFGEQQLRTLVAEALQRQYP